MNLRYENPQTERQVRKRMAAKLYLVIIILLILLGVLNPGKGDFGEYAANHLEDSIGLGIAEGVSSLIVQPVIESFTRRENYILFSVFTVPDIQDNTTFIGDIQSTRKYLGLFKIIFIEL